MPTPSSFRVRFAIVGIASALALAFLISPGHAQPGRPTGGFTGRPPGGIAGNPGGIAGNPGGVSGISGRPPGSITGMPGGATGISGIGGMGGPPGGIGGGIGSQYVWSCGKCGASLGTTSMPFNSIQTCPRCGVRFNGTSINSGPAMGGLPNAGAGGLGVPPVTAPVMTPPVAGETNPPALPTNPAFTNTPPDAPAPAAQAPNETNPPAATSTTENGAESRGKGRAFWLIGIVVGVVLFLGAMAALAVVVANASASKPVKRKRRIRDDD